MNKVVHIRAVHRVFSEWADRSLFTTDRVEKTGGIEWLGDIDLCPDGLYLRLSGKTTEGILPWARRSIPFGSVKVQAMSSPGRRVPDNPLVFIQRRLRERKMYWTY